MFLEFLIVKSSSMKDKDNNSLKTFKKIPPIWQGSVLVMTENPENLAKISI